ncbi:MAG: CAAX prenyl protease-related protein [Rubrivivax sp.]|nr:CAAX prenyl protease-related protein [Rubrivivax sp.]
MPLSIDRATVARVAPFLAYMGFLALRGALPAQPDGGFDARWVYGLGSLAVGALLWHYRHEYVELARLNRPSARETALAVAVGLAVFGAWIHLDAPWMTLDVDAVGFQPTTPDGQPLWAQIGMRWIGATLLVPVMEELFWRSFLMRWLHQQDFVKLPAQQVGLRALLLSTFAFMLAHPLWLAAIVAGLAYAWLYVRTGRLWVPVTAHAVTNGALGLWVVATGNWQFW